MFGFFKRKLTAGELMVFCIAFVLLAGFHTHRGATAMAWGAEISAAILFACSMLRYLNKDE